MVTWIPKYVASQLAESQLLFKLVAVPLCIGRWGGGSFLPSCLPCNKADVITYNEMSAYCVY